MADEQAQIDDFSYDVAVPEEAPTPLGRDHAPQDAAGLPARVAIFGDNDVNCRQIAKDLGGAGFRARAAGPLALLLDGPITPLGDAVVLDCPDETGKGLSVESLAALARLDLRIARSGAKLIVSTTIGALDDVFSALDQSQPQILVSPSRAERMVAIGRTMTQIGTGKVREMSEEDRLALLKLSQQVDAIVKALDKMSPLEKSAKDKVSDLFIGKPREVAATPPADLKASAPVLEKPAPTQSDEGELPDPAMVRTVIANRIARARVFDPELFADPAWDMLLDLTAAEAEGQKVSVTSLCIAANVPATTALRWLRQMVDVGLFERVADPSDKRRSFIALSEEARGAMTRYFKVLIAPNPLIA